MADVKFTKRICGTRAAYHLAITYGAWVKAIAMPEGDERDRSIRMWGRILLDDQEASGVQLREPKSLQGQIESASHRIKARVEDACREAALARIASGRGIAAGTINL